jgi:hypothetical protein
MPNNRVESARCARRAQSRRWASNMRTVSPLVACSVLLSTSAHADTVADFERALEKWRSARVQSYSFIYEWRGAVVIAPDCAGTKIRVVVKNGIGDKPVVTQGNARCPRGTRGKKAIGFDVPATIDEAFDAIRRYIYQPPAPARIVVTYDPTWAVPLTYYVEKLEFEDNDEGFEISGFRVRE